METPQLSMVAKMSLPPNTRKSEYKPTIDSEFGRRKREATHIRIRRIKREDALFKKRREAPCKTPTQLDETVASSSMDNEASLEAMSRRIWMELDSNAQIELTKKFKIMLAVEKNPPIDAVIQSGIVPRLTQFLDKHESPELQLEAAWTLSNIASGNPEQTKTVVIHGNLPKFACLLSSPNAAVREQAAWGVGNLAADNIDYRDNLLELGALEILLSQFTLDPSLSMMRTSTWAISNLCRGKPRPSFETTKIVLPVLQILINTSDNEILSDGCWALSYLSDGPSTQIQAVINAGVCKRVVELLGHDNLTIVVPALRTVGNIVSGDDLQTQFMLHNDVLPQLLRFLTMDIEQQYGIKPGQSLGRLRREACWIVSNIAAENQDNIQKIIDCNMVPHLLELLQHAEFSAKKEAAWALCNMVTGGSRSQVIYLVKGGCLKQLCDMLRCSDPKIIGICLEALDGILSVGGLERAEGNTLGVNVFVTYVEEADGLEIIACLQDHDNDDISVRSCSILAKYWPEFFSEGDFYDVQ